jgi:16S rRNA processing protein RimM
VTEQKPTSTSSTTDPVASSTGETDGTTPSALLEVGRIAKPHGLAGEVVVDLVTTRQERLAPGSVLTTPTGRELTVAASRPFNKRWIVSFVEVPDRDAADLLHSVPLLAEAIPEPDELWVHDLVGAAVEDLGGRPLGTVAAVVANPASDLLELDSGALIPLVFVVEHGPSRILVDIPKGLIE